jgi:hypothetical protein
MIDPVSHWARQIAAADEPKSKALEIADAFGVEAAIDALFALVPSQVTLCGQTLCPYCGCSNPAESAHHAIDCTRPLG